MAGDVRLGGTVRVAGDVLMASRVLVADGIRVAGIRVAGIRVAGGVLASRLGPVRACWLGQRLPCSRRSRPLAAGRAPLPPAGPAQLGAAAATLVASPSGAPPGLVLAGQAGGTVLPARFPGRGYAVPVVKLIIVEIIGEASRPAHTGRTTRASRTTPASRAARASSASRAARARRGALARPLPRPLFPPRALRPLVLCPLV